MTTTVTVVDYGMGNLFSVARALEHCGATVIVTADRDAVQHAERIVLPGVGAFEGGMNGLQERGLVGPLLEFVAGGRPFLGICLGMQMLLEVSEEFGEHRGLGLIPGRVVAIPDTGVEGQPHKIPHIGWNELELPAKSASWEGTILRGIEPGMSVYFVHSFTAAPTDPRYRLADCHYNSRLISAAIRSGPVYGVQFHPEKSGAVGLRIIKAFLELN